MQTITDSINPYLECLNRTYGSSPPTGAHVQRQSERQRQNSGRWKEGIFFGVLYIHSFALLSFCTFFHNLRSSHNASICIILNNDQREKYSSASDLINAYAIEHSIQISISTIMFHLTLQYIKFCPLQSTVTMLSTSLQVPQNTTHLSSRVDPQPQCRFLGQPTYTIFHSGHSFLFLGPQDLCQIAQIWFSPDRKTETCTHHKVRLNNKLSLQNQILHVNV